MPYIRGTIPSMTEQEQAEWERSMTQPRPHHSWAHHTCAFCHAEMELPRGELRKRTKRSLSGNVFCGHNCAMLARHHGVDE